MSDHHDYVLGRLIDREQQQELDDNQAEWAAQRDADLALEPWRYPTDDEMWARINAERAEVEAESHKAHVAELARNKQQRGTAA